MFTVAYRTSRSRLIVSRSAKMQGRTPGLGAKKKETAPKVLESEESVLAGSGSASSRWGAGICALGTSVPGPGEGVGDVGEAEKGESEGIFCSWRMWFSSRVGGREGGVWQVDTSKSGFCTQCQQVRERTWRESWPWGIFVIFVIESEGMCCSAEESPSSISRRGRSTHHVYVPATCNGKLVNANSF